MNPIVLNYFVGVNQEIYKDHKIIVNNKYIEIA